MDRLPQRFWMLCVGALLAGVGARTVVAPHAGSAATTSADASRAALAIVGDDSSLVRSSRSYEGTGIWVDAFDFSPSYQTGATGSQAGDTGSRPPVQPGIVDVMAEHGVDTIYLQAARLDDRSPGLLLEERLLAEFLVRAHAAGLDVVGWYLPTFADVDADLERLVAIAEFEVLGHHFDGVAVDIEQVDAVRDSGERSDRLVELSERLRASRPGEALGAIVPPAVQLEVINRSLWPEFPWRRLDASYDVWLPMAYWTVRSEASGYRDAYRYAEESTRRMRANIGRDVVVHLIGGIGDQTTVGDLVDLGRATADTGAIGASIYDWNSLAPDVRTALATIVPG